MNYARFAHAKAARHMAATALIFLMTRLGALAHEGEIERHWSKPAYRSEVGLQLCLIGGAAVLYCLLRAVWGIVARRRVT